VAVVIESGGGIREITVRCKKVKKANWGRTRRGADIQDLGDAIYIKFNSNKATFLEPVIHQINGSKAGLIIDLRSYIGWGFEELTPHVVREVRDFARLGGRKLTLPCETEWGDCEPIIPRDPAISKKVAVLIDEYTQSHGEYFAMALSSEKNVRRFGSTTAGADGNVSSLTLPDGSVMHITGLDVRWPDMSPTQQVGILPDVYVTSSRSDIAADRDAVLNAALEWITN
jgi:C-terminal processing protease CtpA/Prc